MKKYLLALSLAFVLSGCQEIHKYKLSDGTIVECGTAFAYNGGTINLSDCSDNKTYYSLTNVTDFGVANK